jgi:Ca2+/Na+ antiporter
MNKRAPFVLFVIVLAIIGIVALVFWNSIHASFVAPLSSFFLMVMDFVSMFDQVYLWGFLLFALIMITITKLGKTKPTEPSSHTVRMKVSSAGRLRFWETQVYLLTRGRIPSRYSIHEVRRLLVSVLGYKQHLDTAETDRRLKAGELVFPTQYETFAELDQESDDEQEDLLTILVKTVASMLQGKRQQVIQAREKVLSDLILYMEKQLEIEHDH